MAQNNRQAWASQRQQTFGGSKQQSVEYEEVEVTMCEKLKREMKSRAIIWVIIIVLLGLTIRESTNILRDYFTYPKVSGKPLHAVILSSQSHRCIYYMQSSLNAGGILEESL